MHPSGSRARRAVVSLVGAVLAACATGQVLDDTAQQRGSRDDGGLPISGGAGGQMTGGAGAVPPMTGGSGPVVTGGSSGSGTGAAGGMGNGAGDNGGGTGGDGCDPGLKRCAGICVPPTFGTGCSLDNCDACPDPPLDSQGLCENGECSFLCHDEYVVDAPGTGCEPTSVGGGAGGTAGGTGPVGGTGGTSTGGTGTGGTAGTSTGGTGTGGTSTGGSVATGGSPPATGGTSGGCSVASCPGCDLGMSKCCSSSGNCGCAWGGVFPPSCF